jgi:hypothetical protein
LTANKNNTANRLFNVAMSRARDKFIVVTDKTFDLNGGMTSNNVFSNFLRQGSEKVKCYSGCDVIPKNVSQIGLIQILSYEDGIKELWKDIKCTTRSLYVEIGNWVQFINEKKILSALSKKAEMNPNIVKIYAKSSMGLSKALKKNVIETEYANENVFILNENVVWYVTDAKCTACQVVIRFEGEHTAHMITNLLHMNH